MDLFLFLVLTIFFTDFVPNDKSKYEVSEILRIYGEKLLVPHLIQIHRSAHICFPRRLVQYIDGPGSVVGIATGPEIESRWGEIFRTCTDRPWGPPCLLYNGYHVFPGDKKRPGRDADPSPTSSAVVMKG
jgi:hypothetical protein